MASISAARASGSAERLSSCARTCCRARARSAGDQRGVEAAVPDLAGQVADRRVAQLGGGDQLVDDLPVAVAGVLGQRARVAQPPLQQVRDDRHVRARAAVGEEHPVQGRLQAG